MLNKMYGNDSKNNRSWQHGKRSVGARIVAHGCAQQVEIDQVPVWGRMRTEKEQGTRKRQFCYSLEL